MMPFEQVKRMLKQRFPILMVDRVLELESGVRIKTIKNVTGNEIYFLGHFPDYSIVPGIYIIESIAQSASILFTEKTGKGVNEDELMVLGVVNEMRFLAPVLPGYTMEIEVNVIKIVPDAAIVEGIARVDDEIVAKGKLTFARKKI